MEAVIWIAIALCLTQSGMFSGLNLALLGLSRLRLEAEAAAGSRDAAQILRVREDANFLLTTILWGNVAVNCLLTVLLDSLLVGVLAFLFSTVFITLFGEIIPQAWFSRNAMRVGALLVPAIRLYQWILYPVAKPSALLLDRTLGDEGIAFFPERGLREVIKLHALSPETDLDNVEATGALNFMALDDLPVGLEGERVDPASVVRLPFQGDRPVLPAYERTPGDSFIRRIQASGKKWVILTDADDRPRRVLDADGFLRDALCREGPLEFLDYCHRPFLVNEPSTRLGGLLRQLRVQAEHPEDDVVDRDVILVWGADRRVVTGADLLGRLLRGIVTREGPSSGRADELPDEGL